MSNRVMPAAPEWLRAGTQGRMMGVDRKAKVLRGYVVAQLGPFKSEGRGEFNQEGLAEIVRLMAENKLGTKSRFTHPDMSNDGLGKFLGRAHEPRLSTATVRRDGKEAEIPAVRADLHFDPSAEKTPSGNLSDYVMELAESDPDALSSSLVLQVRKEYRLNPDGTQQTDEDGEPLPPLWFPVKIHASDIVDTGDAVDGLLSAGVDVDGLPLAALWRGAELLDQVFAGQPREAVEARCRDWLGRYLNRRYGQGGGAVRAPAPTAAPLLDHLRRRLRLLERRCRT